jgi:hypothetical protein
MLTYSHKTNTKPFKLGAVPTIFGGKQFDNTFQERNMVICFKASTFQLSENFDYIMQIHLPTPLKCFLDLRVTTSENFNFSTGGNSFYSKP